MYLAAVIDLFSRRIVGHAMSESNDTRLALQALNSAKAARGRIDGLLHHSDRGSPYGSDLYTDRLCALHVQPSMSERGDCWDNAVAESFFSTLEWELLRRNKFATHSQARRIVSEYIDQFFNPIRRHSTNGCFSPIEFELRWQSRQLTVESMCPQNAGKLGFPKLIPLCLGRRPSTSLRVDLDWKGRRSRTIHKTLHRARHANAVSIRACAPEPVNHQLIAELKLQEELCALLLSK